jgi:hypothetical protein
MTTPWSRRAMTIPDNITPDDDLPLCAPPERLESWAEFFRGLPGYHERLEAACLIGHAFGRRKPSLKTVLDQAKKAGASSVTRDGVTYALGQPEQQTDDDTDRELAEFEARHGKA